MWNWAARRYFSEEGLRDLRDFKDLRDLRDFKDLRVFRERVFDAAGALGVVCCGG